MTILEVRRNAEREMDLPIDDMTFGYCLAMAERKAERNGYPEEMVPVLLKEIIYQEQFSAHTFRLMHEMREILSMMGGDKPCATYAITSPA